MGRDRGASEIGHVGRLVHGTADAVTGVFADDAVATLARLDRLLDRVRDVGDAHAEGGSRDAVPHASRVTSESRWWSGSSSPTPNEMAASPCQPSTIAPKSNDTRSPSASTRSPGMP